MISFRWKDKNGHAHMPACVCINADKLISGLSIWDASRVAMKIPFPDEINTIWEMMTHYNDTTNIFHLRLHLGFMERNTSVREIIVIQHVIRITHTAIEKWSSTTFESYDIMLRPLNQIYTLYWQCAYSNCNAIENTVFVCFWLWNYVNRRSYAITLKYKQ